MVKDVYIVPGK
jgi:hypothetical protein